MIAFINSLSPWHLLLLAGLALLFYGNRLPEVARSLGKAVNEFKRGLRDVEDEIGQEPPREPTERQKLRPPPADADEPVSSRTKEPAEQSDDSSAEKG